MNDPQYPQEAVQQNAEKKKKDKKCSYRSEKRTLETQISQKDEVKTNDKDQKGSVSWPMFFEEF